MALPDLPLHIAYRRSLSEEHVTDWEATQYALQSYATARQRRANWLRAVSWGALLLMVLAMPAVLLGVCLQWVAIGMVGAFVVFGMAMVELRQLASRRRPKWLRRLAIENLPRSASGFLAAFRQGKRAAFWLDDHGRRRTILVSLFEPDEALFSLSEDPEFRAIGLPWPKDLYLPNALVTAEAVEGATAPGTELASDELAVVAPAHERATADALPGCLSADPQSESGHRGMIKRDRTVYAAPFEKFRAAAAEQFDPDIAGDPQRDFHALMAIHQAWESKPFLDIPSRIAAQAEKAFAVRKAQERGMQHLSLPGRRSLARLIREERVEFERMRARHGLIPKGSGTSRPRADSPMITSRTCT